MKRLTTAWVRKAEDDYRVAIELSTSKPPSHDHVCFCCQQAVEKYLKALLEEGGATIPRTHNLEALLGLLLPTHLILSSLKWDAFPERVRRRLLVSRLSSHKTPSSGGTPLG